MALPSGYTRLAYIESTGTQYIDTGFKPNNNTRVEISCDFPLTNDTEWLFGSRIASNNAMYGFLKYQSQFRFDFGNTNNYFSATSTTVSVDMNKNKVIRNGTETLSASSQTFSSTANLILLANNTAGTVSGFAKAKLYYCKIYDNGTMVRDFVPCKNASGVVGLYDLKNGTFYSNAVTGTFSYGEVEPTGNHRTMVDSVIWGVPSGRCLVDGVGYSIQKGRTLVDGVGYDVAFGPTGTPAGDIAVGSSVFANVNGVRTEFLVVHQGNPNPSLYDASCDGTWLVFKDIYEQRRMNNRNNKDYSKNEIHTYLNETFPTLFDAAITAKVITAKIPYSVAAGSVKSGTNGLDARFFLLSVREVGGTASSYAKDGATLSYFSDGDQAKCIAYYNGSAGIWYLRSPDTDTTAYMMEVRTGGTISYRDGSKSSGIRPAFVLDSSALVDPNTFDILG